MLADSAGHGCRDTTSLHQQSRETGWEQWIPPARPTWRGRCLLHAHGTHRHVGSTQPATLQPHLSLKEKRALSKTFKTTSMPSDAADHRESSSHLRRHQNTSGKGTSIPTMLDRLPLFLLSLSYRRTEVPSCQHSWAKWEIDLKLGPQTLLTLWIEQQRALRSSGGASGSLTCEAVECAAPGICAPAIRRAPSHTGPDRSKFMVRPKPCRVQWICFLSQ